MQDQEVSIGRENVAEQWEQDWLLFSRSLQLLLGAGGGLLNGGLVLQIIQLNPCPAVCIVAVFWRESGSIVFGNPLIGIACWNPLVGKAENITRQ
jgi:hypothetical protein